MEIIIAKTAGFCFGVKRAVQLAFETEVKQHTYTLGPIIHNDAVIQRLEERGIRSIDQVDQFPVEKLIIRAHGVGASVYEQAQMQDIEVIDATCPYVTKIHKLVKTYFEQGYGILVVGDATHPEIIGINGWANNQCIIVKDCNQLKTMHLDKTTKYLLVSQTTYKKAVVDEIVHYLEQNAYQLTYIPTICSATKERQEEALEIAKQVDTMIVIGSALSSNTQKLYEICLKYCEHTYCIADEKALSKEMIRDTQKLGITAGASTPHDVIESVLYKVKQSKH